MHMLICPCFSGLFAFFFPLFCVFYVVITNLYNANVHMYVGSLVELVHLVVCSSLGIVFVGRSRSWSIELPRIDKLLFLFLLLIMLLILTISLRFAFARVYLLLLLVLLVFN